MSTDRQNGDDCNIPMFFFENVGISSEKVGIINAKSMNRSALSYILFIDYLTLVTSFK